MRIAIFILATCFALTVSAYQSRAQDEIRRFRVGVAIGTDEFIRERVEPFRLVLEDAVDMPVDLYLIDTLGELVDALAKGDVDYARLSPSAYAAAFTLCTCVEPIVTARPDTFPARFYGVAIGRKREQAIALQDLKEGRLGVMGSQSVAGYRVPLVNLAAEGIDSRAHFRSVIRIQDPVKGLQAILDGRIDVSFGWSTLTGDSRNGYTAGTLNDFYLSGAAGFDKLEVLWQSPAIPYSAHAVRLDLPDSLKERLRSALLKLRSRAPDAYLAIEPDLPGGFEPVIHADYIAVLRTYEPQFQAVLSN